MTRLAEFSYPRDNVVTYPELRAIGMSKAAIHRCCERGILHRVAFGVYVFGSGILTFRGRVRAATAIRGPHAGGHNYASLAIHGCLDFEPRIIDVLTTSRCSPRADVRYIRCDEIEPEDLVQVGFVTVTSIPRAVVGLAETLPHDRITKLLRDVRYRHLLDLGAVERAADRTSSRQAAVVMQQAIDRFTQGSNGSWSGNEHLAWEVLHDVVPDEVPLQNPRFVFDGNPVYPDLCWAGSGVVAEVDGFPHQFGDVLIDDAARDRGYRRQALTPLRLQPHDLVHEREAVREDVRRVILASRERRR